MDGDFETLLNGQQFKKLFEKMSCFVTEKYGIHKIEIEILLFLHSEKYDTAKDIAEWKFFSKAHISNAIEHLMECGYLVGKPDSHDRRCIHLKLTKEAEPICEDLVKLKKDLLSILYKGVSEEDKKTIRTVAKKIANNINEVLLEESLT